MTVTENIPLVTTHFQPQIKIIHEFFNRPYNQDSMRLKNSHRIHPNIMMHRGLYLDCCLMTVIRNGEMAQVQTFGNLFVDNDKKKIAKGMVSY